MYIHFRKPGTLNFLHAHTLTIKHLPPLHLHSHSLMPDYAITSKINNQQALSHPLKLSSVKYNVTKLHFYNNKSNNKTFNNQNDCKNMKVSGDSGFIAFTFCSLLIKIIVLFHSYFCIAYLKALRHCMPIIYNILTAFEISQLHWECGKARGIVICMKYVCSSVAISVLINMFILSYK